MGQGSSSSSIHLDMDKLNLDDDVNPNEIPTNPPSTEVELSNKVFGNHLTFTKILNNIPPEDLLKFRLVNQYWKEEVTKLALKNLNISIGLEYFTDFGYCLVKQSSSSSSSKTKTPLSELNASVEITKLLPCQNFCINGFELDDSELKTFFTLCGSTIKSLSLTMKDNAMILDMKILRNLLLNQAPNIQTLNFLQVPQDSNQDQVDLLPQKAELPKLETLGFDQCFPQISEIIRSSPNLKQVNGGSLEAAATLISMNKMHLITNLSLLANDITCFMNGVKFMWCDINFMHVLGKLVDSKIKLKKLELKRGALINYDASQIEQFPQPQFATLLSKMLDLSKTSLQNLSLNVDSHFFEGVDWPILENVESLTVQGYFEALEEFAVLVSFRNRAMPYTEVSQLFTQLLSVLPNIIELKMCQMKNLGDLAKFIWSFPKLKKLELSFALGSQFRHQHDFEELNAFPFLDGAFTGIPQAIIRRLNNDPKYFEEAKTKPISRSQDSILNCKDLELLKIEFVSRNPKDPKEVPNTLFSAVTGEFGFKLMPKLKVEISFTPSHWTGNTAELNAMELSLKPIAPFVKLVKIQK